MRKIFLGFGSLVAISGFVFFAFSAKASASQSPAPASCACVAQASSGQAFSQPANADADGSYFVDTDGMTIYLISQGLRRPFASPWELSTYTSQPIKQIVAASAALPNLAADRALPVGTIMRAKANVVVLNSVDKQYYLTYDGGGKLPFATQSSFTHSVYGKYNVNSFDLTYYARGWPATN